MKHLQTTIDRTVALISALRFCISACGSSNGPPAYADDVGGPRAEPSQVFWGDTHLHTSYSPDAYFFGNETADPDTAYRYAKGLAGCSSVPQRPRFKSGRRSTSSSLPITPR